jgi:hypothetical protein
MKMQALVALRNFPYAGKQMKNGDIFQASEKDARILITLRRAQADPAPHDEQRAVLRDTETAALVHEVMQIQPRPRGRPPKPRTAPQGAE